MASGDWMGGLKPQDDYFLAEPPEFTWIREGASFWIYDDEGRFAIPRTGIEAESHTWESRRYNANFTLPDSRMLTAGGSGAMHAVMDECGKPAVLGAGPIEYRCIEPFKRWLVSFDGEVQESTYRDPSAPTRSLPLRYQVELTMAVPADVAHNTPENFFALGKGQQRDAMSVGLGWRLEQLFTADGWVELDGGRETFKGRGLRVKRRSVRTDGLFLRGHCWQSAVFPDGRAFGYLCYPPHEDGNEAWNFGFVYADGVMHPAKVTNPPWLKDLEPAGEDVSCELESDLGTVRISGRTVMPFGRKHETQLWGLTLQQSGVIYEWDGQRAHGMIERSNPVRK